MRMTACTVYKHMQTNVNTHVCQRRHVTWAHTLGVGEGAARGWGERPGEALFVLVLPQVPLLPVKGGVLQPAPTSALGAVLCLAAVMNNPVGNDLLRAALWLVWLDSDKVDSSLFSLQNIPRMFTQQKHGLAAECIMIKHRE